MGTVYSAPKEIEVPGIMPLETYSQRLREYEEAIVSWIKARYHSKYAGKSIRFQVADGYATYYIFSLSPVKLIHDNSADGYAFPYIERLTAGDIKKHIGVADAYAKLFSGE